MNTGQTSRNVFQEPISFLYPYKMSENFSVFQGLKKKNVEKEH